MNTKERHIKENEAHRHEDPTTDVIADSLKAESKRRERKSSIRVNKLWLWLGVLVLIAILIWWLFTYVLEVDLFGGFNG